jgi:hypothetical protein
MMRRTEDQKNQKVSWAQNGIEPYQGVVRVEQSLDAVTLRVPRGTKLSEDGKSIEWTEDKQQSDTRQYEPCCLQELLTLTQPTPEKVLRFAQRWGAMVFVEEGQILDMLSEEDDNPEQRKAPAFKPEHTESLSRWSDMASQMEAVLELISYLWTTGDREEKPAKVAWKTLTKGTSSLPPLNSELNAEEAIRDREAAVKALVGIMVTSWLDDIGAAPLVAWEGEAFCLRLWLPNKRWASLQSALVLHLVTVISNPQRLFRCGWCGRRSLKTEQQRMTRRGCVPHCEDEKCLRKFESAKANRCNKKARAEKQRREPKAD